jgi:DNA-binding Lrp family transcriptional regulator
LLAKVLKIRSIDVVLEAFDSAEDVLQFLPMKLSSHEVKVLAALNKLGRVPLQQLAKEAGLKSHSVRYALDRMLERKALVPCCAVNLYGIGLNNYIVYFSFKAASHADEERAVQIAAAHQQVTWVAELSGDYQYGMEVLASSTSEAVRVIGEVSRAMGVPWFRKAFIETLSLDIWPLKYFAKQEPERNVISQYPVERRHEIDSVDHKILRLKVEQPLASDEQIARVCGVPSTTVGYRLKKLESAGVITGYCFTPIWDALQISQFKIVVSLKGVDEQQHERLFAFARRAENCILALRCVGAWDFEFNIFVVNADEARQFTTLLWRQFGEVLDDVRSIAYPRTIKRVSYPFTDEQAVLRATGRGKSAARAGISQSS